MSLSKLWQQLFTTNNEETDIALHIAGATSRHRNPFESLPTHRNQNEPSDEFIDKWVMEFYMVSIANSTDQTFAAFVQAAKEITPDIVRELWVILTGDLASSVPTSLPSKATRNSLISLGYIFSKVRSATQARGMP
jgi:hypothetical protein